MRQHQSSKHVPSQLNAMLRVERSVLLSDPTCAFHDRVVLLLVRFTLPRLAHEQGDTEQPTYLSVARES